MPGELRRWFRCWRQLPRPRVRLVCFPHAGGTAGFFRSWAADSPPDVEVLGVQYPGREDRIRESMPDTMECLADLVAEALGPVLDRPVALFGHSMGAAAAHLVAHRLEERAQAGGVARLFVSGRPAPLRDRGGAAHLLRDDELWEELRRLGGTSEEVLDCPELRRLVLPAIRADYRLSETCRPAAGTLGCPVTAFLGDRDPEVTLDEAMGWAGTTRAGFSLHVFPGDHFYLVGQQTELLGAIGRTLNGEVHS
ncbi:MAG TPA: alpha/beta fold hydrolase [Actinomycetota bacterium]